MVSMVSITTPITITTGTITVTIMDITTATVTMEIITIATVHYHSMLTVTKQVTFRLIRQLTLNVWSIQVGPSYFLSGIC